MVRVPDITATVSGRPIAFASSTAIDVMEERIRSTSAKRKHGDSLKSWQSKNQNLVELLLEVTIDQPRLASQHVDTSLLT
jgi:hypothetical protein